MIDTQVLRKWQLWYVSRFQLSKFLCRKKILFGSYPGWNVNPNWDGKQYCEQHFPFFSFMRPFPDKLTLSEWIDPFFMSKYRTFRPANIYLVIWFRKPELNLKFKFLRSISYLNSVFINIGRNQRAHMQCTSKEVIFQSLQITLKLWFQWCCICVPFHQAKRLERNLFGYEISL